MLSMVKVKAKPPARNHRHASGPLSQWVEGMQNQGEPTRGRSLNFDSRVPPHSQMQEEPGALGIDIHRNFPRLTAGV